MFERSAKDLSTISGTRPAPRLSKFARNLKLPSTWYEKQARCVWATRNTHRKHTPVSPCACVRIALRVCAIVCVLRVSRVCSAKQTWFILWSALQRSASWTREIILSESLADRTELHSITVATRVQIIFFLFSISSFFFFFVFRRRCSNTL